MKILINLVKILFYRITYDLFCLFPINKNKIFISSFDGMYNDSPKVISDALLEKKIKGLKIIWALKDKSKLVDNRIVTCYPNSIRYLYHLATARIWIDNKRKPSWVHKRSRQYYIQTWHGGVALKKVEKDAFSLSENYKKKAMKDSKMIDLFISECEWRTKNIQNSFWYDGKILKGGLGRVKIINREIVYTEIANRYNLIDNEKIILYAPTFRNNYDLNCYNINYEKIIEALKIRFGGDWVFLVRLHPNFLHKTHNLNLPNNVYNVTDYPSIQQLIVASDIVLTDFSGCMFDAMKRDKILMLIALDYDRYISQERGLYFDLEQFPTPMSKTTEELIANIREFNIEKYKEKKDILLNNIGYYTNNIIDTCIETIQTVIKDEDCAKKQI